MKKIRKYINIILIVSLVLVTIAMFFLLYQNHSLQNQKEILIKELSTKTLKLNGTIDVLSAVQSNFTNVKNEKNKLKKDLDNETLIMASLQNKVKNVSNSVGTLEKLSKTDKELLQKYSKVYFLNENYIPSKLTQIDSKYLYDKSTDKWIHAKVWPYLQKMLDDAKVNGIDLLIESAYRSFETQTQLKDRYSMTYGSGANKFSADQGYSEHQLGTTVDLTTKGLAGNFSAFKDSDAYKWLIDNAYKYGFILSYPKNNKYYVFESWHWRFVGVKLAEKLHSSGIYFYDLTQREIDKYLVDIFD